MSHGIYGDPAVRHAITDLIAERRAEFAGGRTFIGVTRRATPQGGSYWLPLGPPRVLPAIAALDATGVGVELGAPVEFVVAACEAGRVVNVLDEDGDPLDWDDGDRAELDTGIRAVWAVQNSVPAEPAPAADRSRPEPDGTQLLDTGAQHAGRARRRTEDQRQAKGVPGDGELPRPPR